MALTPHSPVSASPAVALPRLLVVTLATATAFGPMAIDMYLPAFPRIAEALNVPIDRVQMTIPAFLIGLAVGQLLWGSLSDRIGRRPPLLIGSLAFSVAAVLGALSASIEVLLFARVLMGVAGSAGVVVTRAVVRDLFSARDAARMFATMMLVMGLAPVLAPSFGGWVLIFFQWPVIFWLLAGFGLFAAALVARNLPETLAPAARVTGSMRETLRHYLHILRHRRFLSYSLAGACASGVMFSYIAGSPYVFMDLYGLSSQRYSLLFGLTAVVFFASAQLNRLLLRRWQVSELMPPLCALSAGFGLLLLTVTLLGTGGVTAFYLCQSLCIVSLGLLFPNSAAAAMHEFPHRAGSASAVLGMLQYAVGASAGVLVSLLHDGTALPMAMGLAFFSVAGFAVLALQGRYLKTAGEAASIP